jgi:E3 ubiquitin-protein ligase KEG
MEFTCALCLDELEEPASLACGHSFCLACLRSLVSKGRGAAQPCPLCRAEGAVPASDAALHVNIVARDAIAAARALVRARAVEAGGGSDMLRASLRASLPRGAADLEFERDAQGDRRELGRGAYGLVLAARMKVGVAGAAATGADVAVKVFRGNKAATADVQQAVWHEAELMAALRHENILAVIGVYETRDDGGAVVELGIVLPRMRFSLRGWLTQAAAVAADGAGREPGLQPRLRLCRDVARGLASMHSRSIVHRDVSHNNVLISLDGCAAVLSDLGTAAVRVGAASDAEGTDPGGRGPRGTAQFMDPAIASRRHSFRAASDVYSFSILAWELLSGAPLYPGLDFAGAPFFCAQSTHIASAFLP